MKIGDREVSKWSLVMLVMGTFMFVSMFLNMVSVDVLGNRYGISGIDLLTGEVSLGFMETGAESFTMMRYIPFIAGIIGAAVTMVSVASIATGSTDRRGFMTALSLLLTITLFAMVMFLLIGTSIEIFSGSAKNLLIGFGATISPMYGVYIAIFSTFLCGMATTYRMRECMQ